MWNGNVCGGGKGNLFFGNFLFGFDGTGARGGFSGYMCGRQDNNGVCHILPVHLTQAMMK